MKSLHCVYSGGRFADQYTLDLEGFMSPHEFTATISTFNTAAWHYPPPIAVGSSASGVNYYLVCLSSIILIGVITAIHYTQQIGIILLLPFSFLVFSMILIYWRRRQAKKFESAMIHLCSCMNATENVRGINFRLSFLTPEQQQIDTTSTYAITIEFDDRYNLLHHFNNQNRQPPPPPAYYENNITPSIVISPPLNAYYPNEKQVANSLA